jgi:ribosomal protein S8
MTQETSVIYNSSAQNLISLFLKEGYSLIVTPIEVMTNRNHVEEYSYDDDMTNEVIEIYLLNFPKKVYQWNDDKQEVEIKNMKKWPKSLEMSSVMNGMEASAFAYDESQETGNEGPPPENHYLSGAMIIMKTQKEQGK